MTVAELSPIEKAVQMYAKGSTPKEVAESLGIPEGTAKSWKVRHYNPIGVSATENEIQELKLKIQSSETEIQKLKRKIQTDEAEFQKLNPKIQSSETEIQKLKLKIQADETEFQKLKRKIQTDETKIQANETEFQKSETQIQELKRKIQANETEFQKLKRSESELTNEAKLLRGQIKGLEQQIEFRDKSTQSGLNNQEKLLMAQIADLKAQLSKVEAKLDTAQTEERQRAEAVKVAHEKAIEALKSDFKKERLQIEAKHQATTEGWVSEKQALLDDKEKAIEAANEEKRFLLNDKVAAIETLTQEHEAALKIAKDYAAKWEGIEKSMSKELFLRRLGFAFAIVTPLIIVQGIEVGLFAQLAYKDASYSGDWIKIVGAILSFGFQGTGLFLTINRNKIIRGIKIGVDEDANPIYQKDEQGNIKTETCYDMTTMKVLCCVDFLINCFVLFGNATTDLDYGAIARLVCFSMLTPLGIFFTSEILLNIIDKKEKLIQ